MYIQMESFSIHNCAFSKSQLAFSGLFIIRQNIAFDYLNNIGGLHKAHEWTNNPLPLFNLKINYAMTCKSRWNRHQTDYQCFPCCIRQPLDYLKYGKTSLLDSPVLLWSHSFSSCRVSLLILRQNIPYIVLPCYGLFCDQRLGMSPFCMTHY